MYETINFLSFIQGYFHWMANLTFWELLGLLSFVLVDLLIPAHNEGASIKNTIESLLDNTYPNKEIIVIDDHSTDNTFDQAYPYYKRGQIRLIKRSEGKGSKSGAINFGTVFATGEVILVMDGDTLLERGALKDVVRAMTVPDVVAVAGNVRILGGDNGVTNVLKCHSYEYLIAFELGRRIRLMMGVLVIIPGAFGAFRNKPDNCVSICFT
jgi:poly-beta-1,6-N-acetyl-D-glucosamine synthase